jgi:hypothetical protein
MTRAREKNPMISNLKHEAWAALNELPSIYQTIGKLNVALSKRKFGTSKHREIWNSITGLEVQADKLTSIIRIALFEPEQKLIRG